MGRQVLGSVAATLASWVAFSWCRLALAQPAPEPVVLEESANPPPAAQPASPPAKAAAPAEPPPLYPPPPQEPAQRPGFLRTREELEQVQPASPRSGARARMPRPDFVDRASPWVDFSLTSFYMKDRVGNFLNFGVQAGGYFFQHLRLTARVVAPLEEVRDNRNHSDFASSGPNFLVTSSAPSRNMSVLYGASVGLVLSNDRSFVFGPNLGFARTDVEDYGTAVLVGLPFEWTTGGNLRVGFELAVGHATGGSALDRCTTTVSGVSVSCGVTSAERQGGTAVIFSYYMGWSLGRL